MSPHLVASSRTVFETHRTLILAKSCIMSILSKVYNFYKTIHYQGPLDWQQGCQIQNGINFPTSLLAFKIQWCCQWNQETSTCSKVSKKWGQKCLIWLAQVDSGFKQHKTVHWKRDATEVTLSQNSQSNWALLCEIFVTDLVIKHWSEHVHVLSMFGVGEYMGNPYMSQVHQLE